MSKEQIEKLRLLAEKRDTLEGSKLYKMLLNLATTHYAVNRNYEELSAAIKSYEGNIEIWDIRNRDKLNSFLREIARLLHNYLSSTFSLIRHTSKLCGDLGSKEFRKEYDKKVTDFNSNGCVYFIRDLRNFSQHVGIPPPAASVSPVSGNSGFKSRIILTKKTLLKWKEWKGGSVKFILSTGDINLRTVIDQYQNLLTRFYLWFYRRVIEYHKSEFDEFIKVEREIGDLNTELQRIMGYSTQQPNSQSDSNVTGKASDGKT
jgi:hypothetical protein